MPSVLILGARAPVALDHARRFVRQGWVATVADSFSCRLSTWSRSVAHGVRLPPPRFSAAAFVAALAKTIDTHRIDLVLPSCEEALFVSRYRSALPRSVNVFVDNFDKLARLHSKLEFLILARESGIAVPPSAGVHNIAAARDWAGTRAIVLKPEFSRFGAQVRLYPEGLPADAPELPAARRWVVQEYCAGTEICSYGIAVSGRLVAHVVYEPRYRHAGSSGFYFEPLVRPQLRAAIARLVAQIGYTGQISFDWIEAADGALTVIECNPRAVSGLHLFSVDAALPAAIMNASADPVESAPQPRMISAIMATVGLVAASRQGKLAQWARDYGRASDVVTVPRDRAPLAGSILDFIDYWRLATSQRCTLREAATRDIEWDGQALCDP